MMSNIVITPDLESRFLSFVIKGAGPDDCWGWRGATVHGYGQIAATGKGGMPRRAHRVSYVLFVGPIPDGLMVLHRCDNPICTNPKHLFTGTQRDNISDMISKGRANRFDIASISHLPKNWRSGDDHHNRLHPEWMSHGEAQHLSKLTDEKVREIRAKHATGGIAFTELATEYGVSAHAIYCVVKRKTWKHVE